jgi:hypothetical protein
MPDKRAKVELRGLMKPARSLLSAVVLGGVAVCFIFVTGCASTGAVGEPPVETVAPPPVVDQASIQAMGPPPGYVKPENYWVREKIILTSAPEPPASAPQKRSGKTGKPSQKR